MFIVKNKGEVIRFGLFLLLMGAMAFFVASRVESWRTSGRAQVRSTQPAVSPVTEITPPPSLIEKAQAAPDGANFFADFRMERERTRSALSETLKDVMENQAAAADTRHDAGAQYLATGRFAALEDRAEQMVKAKGFDDAVVNLSDSSAHVVVMAKELSPQQYMQVADMVSRITGIKATGIHVFNRER
jgi:stage III sporulation protein AH